MTFHAKKGMMRSRDDGNVASTSEHLGTPPQVPSTYYTSKRSGSNVFNLLAKREISPRAKQSSKKLWGDSYRCNADRLGPDCDGTDAKHALVSWVEAESLRHLSAKYCPLLPPPRSTIAAAFSPDGRTLASTHGDHTVKIIDCQSGSCLKVLSGHRRTPWVVRFHPLHPEILASGSLDHEVRLWDANTAECIGSRDFYRPIASIAFHAQGELLAVASGHKLYIWHYNKRGETFAPTIVLKTRRSLRAVHFHPHAAPFLLTAEVNDLDSPDSPMTQATSAGYLHYPPPAVFFANVHSGVRKQSETNMSPLSSPFLFWPFARDEGRTSLQHVNRPVGLSSLQQMVDSSASLQLQSDINAGNQHDYLVSPSPMEVSPVIHSSSYQLPEDLENAVPDSAMDIMETTEMNQQNDSQTLNRQPRPGYEVTPGIYLSNVSGNSGLQMLLRSGEIGQIHQFFPFGDPMFWELPFVQGWLMGQSQAGLHPMVPPSDAIHENSSGIHLTGSYTAGLNLLARSAESQALNGVSQSRTSGARHRSSRSRSTTLSGTGEGAAFINITNGETELQPVVARTESELASSLAAAAATELPCTVKLRIWPHDINNPCASLDAEKCRLTIPHAVLCSEMGAHFSPCGRFLAACVACTLLHMEADPGLQSQVRHGVTGASTSPTRHPISGHQAMYELRIYSLEEAT